MERHVDLLLGALREDIEVANLVANDRFETEVSSEYGYPLIKAAAAGSVAGVSMCPTMASLLWRFHQRTPIDILHLHYPNPMAHVASWVLPASVKRVVTWHSDIVRQRKLFALYRPFLSNSIRRADAIVLPTPAHRSSSDQLAVVGDDERFAIIPFGFELGAFLESPPKALDIRGRYGSRPLLFALGRHVYYKGFEYLIASLLELPNAQLVIGGSGPLTPSLRALSKRIGVADRVDFVGQIKQEELAAYYHACDIFCMPSIARSEAFGIVQIEAMACGKPVVCCELGNGVTYVNRHGETGLVVPPRDVPALAAAIGRLIQDHELRRWLGDRARARVFDEFTMEAMRVGTLELYERLLSGKAASGTPGRRNPSEFGLEADSGSP